MTLKRIAELLHATLIELNKGFNGEAKAHDLFQALEQKLNLTEEERSTTATSSTPRWKTNVQFYSVGPVKAGYLIKSGRRWMLTDSGKLAVESQGPEAFYRDFDAKYKVWEQSRGTTTQNSVKGVDVAGTPEVERGVNLEEARDQARLAIERYLDSFEGSEFQDMVTELLVAQGYTVKFNSSGKGADGGIDIIAYKDAYGFERIIVEVKHKKEAATPIEIAYLEHNIGDGAIGLFVSTGGFTKSARDAIKSTSKHIDTMDIDDFLEQWQVFFSRVSRKGQEMLPLVPVYFLEPKVQI